MTTQFLIGMFLDKLPFAFVGIAFFCLLAGGVCPKTNIMSTQLE